MKRMKRISVFLVALLLICQTAGAEFVFTDVTPAPEDAQQSTPAAQTAPAQEETGWPRTIVVTVGGDCTIGCTDGQRERADGFTSVVEKQGMAWPFSGLAEYFQHDDLTLVNFEGTLTESTSKVEKLYNFKAPAEYAKILTLGSVEAVTLANNHSRDYGDEGWADTKAALDAEGIVHCAKGETAIYEVRGVKIGLIGNTFPYKDGKCDIKADVKALREAGCQIVIASFHWGSENEYDFTRDQRNIGRAAIKAGADVVVGHHPHRIQGIEQYEGRYIVYSLANLVFGGNIDPDDRDTFIARLTFSVNEDGTADPPDLKLVPVRVTELDKSTDYRPVIAQGEEWDRILKKILSRSSNMGDFQNPED